MPDCLCRTEGKKRWVNAGCKEHGVHSSAADNDAETTQIDKLMGRNQ